MNISKYMQSSIEAIVERFNQFSIGNLKEAAFLARFSIYAKSAANIRDRVLSEGESVPPFLICSITRSCNLFCKGCYARALNHQTSCEAELGCEKWDSIFSEAEDIGISFLLLAGGEPLMRRDVIEAAAKHKKIVFPIFTNGTMLDDAYVRLLDKNRNLLPVFSIEGKKIQTDARRGNNIFKTLMEKMEALKARSIPFGVSVTVTSENIKTVADPSYIDDLHARGCVVVFFVEYVPVSPLTEPLALKAEQTEELNGRCNEIRDTYDDMIVLSFPGDEKYLGGCLAAGRGFFHISATGNAEPCPFSPFSDVNLKDNTLLSALKSPFFARLKSSGALAENHTGGCALFAQRDKVEALAAK